MRSNPVTCGHEESHTTIDDEVVHAPVTHRVAALQQATNLLVHDVVLLIAEGRAKARRELLPRALGQDPSAKTVVGTPTRALTELVVECSEPTQHARHTHTTIPNRLIHVGRLGTMVPQEHEAIVVRLTSLGRADQCEGPLKQGAERPLDVVEVVKDVIRMVLGECVVRILDVVKLTEIIV